MTKLDTFCQRLLCYYWIKTRPAQVFTLHTHCMIQTTWVTVSLNTLTANKILPGNNVLPFLAYNGSFFEYKHTSMTNSTLWITKQWPTGRNDRNWLSAYSFLNVTQQISMNSPVMPNHLWWLQGTWSILFWLNISWQTSAALKYDDKTKKLISNHLNAWSKII